MTEGMSRRPCGGRQRRNQLACCTCSFAPHVANGTLCVFPCAVL